MEALQAIARETAAHFNASRARKAQVRTCLCLRHWHGQAVLLCVEHLCQSRWEVCGTASWRHCQLHAGLMVSCLLQSLVHEVASQCHKCFARILLLGILLLVSKAGLQEVCSRSLPSVGLQSSG